jgi:hypothetical protein
MPGTVFLKPVVAQLHNFPGISGPITFDLKHDLTKQHRVFRVKAGMLQLED